MVPRNLTDIDNTILHVTMERKVSYTVPNVSLTWQLFAANRFSLGVLRWCHCLDASGLNISHAAVCAQNRHTQDRHLLETKPHCSLGATSLIISQELLNKGGQIICTSLWPVPAMPTMHLSLPMRGVLVALFSI